MQDANRYWRRGIRFGDFVSSSFGVVYFLQQVGIAHWARYTAFAAGLIATGLWMHYARPSRWRQVGVLAISLVYVLAAPLLATGAWSGLIFVAGMMLPVTLSIAAIYFGARGRTRPARRAE